MQSPCNYNLHDGRPRRTGAESCRPRRPKDFLCPHQTSCGDGSSNRNIIAQMEPIPVKCDLDNGVRMLTLFICDSHAEITETFPVPKIGLTVPHAATCVLAPRGTDHPCARISVQHHLQPEPVFGVFPAHGQREQDEFCGRRVSECENSRKLMILGVWSTVCKLVATPTRAAL